MAERRDDSWLKAELMRALGWDDFVVEGVVDVISKAKSAEEVQDIVQDFMENSPTAISIISDYMEARNTAKQPQKQQQPANQPPPQQRAAPLAAASAHTMQQQQQQQQPRGSYSASVASAPKPSPVERAAATKHEKEKWLNLGGHGTAEASSSQQGATNASKEAAAQAKQQAEVTLSMFKRGGRLPAKPKPAGGGTSSSSSGKPAVGGSSSSGGHKKGDQLSSLTANLERKVANCLSCGKIYDCRNVTNDIIKFIQGGFRCTFCGTAVAMTQQQRIQQAQQEPPGADAAGGGAAAAAAATAQAVAFKDRLVDYDRHSQQRTTVIDDQSDFFEIDTNAWLSEEERAELRRRKQLEEEAAAARRNKVYVTLDLLGRKVLVTDEAGAAGAGAAGAAAGGGASFQVVSATEQLRRGLEDLALADGGETPAVGSGAATAVGNKASAESAEALSKALAAVRDLRISANPNISTPPPVFVPTRHLQQQKQQQGTGAAAGRQQQKQEPKGQQQQQQQQTVAADKAKGRSKGQKKAPGRGRGGGAAARAAAADFRVQDDSLFTEFEAELLYDEVMQQQQQPGPTQKATAVA